MVRNKKNPIQLYTQEHQPDVFVLVEHGLKDTEMESFGILNYDLANYFCRETCKGGGVAIDVKSNVDVETVKQQSVNNMAIEKTCETAV